MWAAIAAAITSVVWVEAAEKPKGIKRERSGRGVVTLGAAKAARATVAASVPAESLVLDLFPGVRHTASVKKTAIAGGTAWSGRVDGFEHSAVTVVQVGDAFAGSVMIPGEGSFVINPAANGETRVLEMDPQLAPACSVADELPDGSPAMAAAELQPAISSATSVVEVIDLMLVYSPYARDHFGGTSGVEAKAESLVFGLNTAFANSGIRHRVRLVHTEEVSYPADSTVAETLSRLTDPADGYLDDIQGLRTRYQADLVAMIAGNEDVFSDGAAGIASLSTAMFPYNSRFSAGFSVVDAYWADYAFAHEIGHNFGCMHDRDNSDVDGVTVYAFGHRWKGFSGTTWRDLMSYGPGVRVPHFTNPDVLYDGVPTGVPVGRRGAADCARAIDLMAGVVADYRTSDRDGDGMGDEWERRHGLDPADPGDADGNEDSDAYDNREEFARYLNPRAWDTPPSGYDRIAIHHDGFTNAMSMTTKTEWELTTELKSAAKAGFFFTANDNAFITYGERDQSDFSAPMTGRAESGFVEDPVHEIALNEVAGGLYRIRLNPDTWAYAVDKVPGLKWSGNVSHAPAAGQITPTNDLWISVESYPTGTIARAEVFTSVNGANWRVVPMSPAGRTGNNDRWRANLGKHPGGAVINYSIALVDRAGVIRMVNNAALYSATVNAGRTVEWVGNILGGSDDGTLNPIDDVWLSAESAPRGAAAYARFVYTTNDVDWISVEATRGSAGANNDLWKLNIGKVPAGTHVQYVVKVVDGRGHELWRNNNGYNYGVLSMPSGEAVKWAGNVTTWPPQGQIDAGERLWVDLETWPATAADSGLVEYTCDGLRWETAPLDYAGRKGNNAWWHFPLGRFAEGKEIRFRVRMTDGTGKIITMENKGEPYFVSVNERRHAPVFCAVDPAVGVTDRVVLRPGAANRSGPFELGTFDTTEGTGPCILARPVERGDGSKPDTGPVAFTTHLRYTTKANDWSSAKTVQGVFYPGGYNNEPLFEYVVYQLPRDVVFADDVYFYLVAENDAGAGYATKPGEVFHIRIASEVTP